MDQAVRSSSSGPGFEPQHPCTSSQPNIALVSEDVVPSSGLCGHQSCKWGLSNASTHEIKTLSFLFLRDYLDWVPMTSPFSEDKGTNLGDNWRSLGLCRSVMGVMQIVLH